MLHRVFDVLARGAAKLAANTVILSLREGYIALIPFFIMAALVSLVTHWLGYEHLQGPYAYLYSFNNLIWTLFPITTLLSFSYYLAKNLKLNTFAAPILVLTCFCVATGYIYALDSGGVGINNRAGVLYTILMPIFCCYLLRSALSLRWLRIMSVGNVSLFLVKHLNLMLPYVLTVFVTFVLFPYVDSGLAACLSWLSASHSDWSQWQQLISQIIFSHVFWLFGIHGDNTYHILASAELTGFEVVPGLDNYSFLSTFVALGGSGGIWGLLIACLLQGKQSHESQIAKLSAPFSLFNISEIMMYAVPVVFNPFFIIPFLLCPLVNAAIAYALLQSGALTLSNIDSIPWFTPVLLSGYLLTGSFIGVALQVGLVAINTLVYLPFVRANSAHNISGRELDILVKRVSAGRQLERHVEAQFAKRNTAQFADQRQLHKVISALKEGTLCLYYQPKVDNTTHKIIGFEALLRLKQADGQIKAPWFIDVLERFEMMDVVDSFVIDQLELDLLQFQRHQMNPKISFNISPDNLINRRYRRVLKAFSKFPGQVEVEILESSYNNNFERTKEIVDKLRAAQILCAVDDFGTGYSCLNILSKLNVDTIKFDRSLLPVNAEDKATYLYENMSQLCNKLGFSVVAEGVESPFHVDYIATLPVNLLQGYYFDMPLTLEQAMRRYSNS
ncbi:diguanylate cyclase/phosphodiesterase [Pseudoalteromonas sp. SW0106-04]|uniref:EAL domain-containing protein n=1 Tax=Pseudoalteromonas TaxID=53246 RepID=UPI0006C0A688|nr:MULTISPECIES: EAL domain-containing protein [Pseudoalteromonas]GAP73644.1 diguanylate cyclase/phosphodiesterase [Pseudoalteromonas sp. SW0106-04]